MTYAQREHSFTQLQIPPIKSHSTNTSKSHHPELKSVLFASCHSRNQLHPSKLNNSNQSSSVFKYINLINSRMPSKKKITRVRFNDASRAADQPSTSDNTTRLYAQVRDRICQPALARRINLYKILVHRMQQVRHQTQLPHPQLILLMLVPH